MSQLSTGLGDAERLVVSPRGACAMLGIGITHLYQLIADGELDTYLDGRARKITVASIHRRIARLLAENGHTLEPAPRRRGRPRKVERQAQHTADTPSPRRRGRPRKAAAQLRPETAA